MKKQRGNILFLILLAIILFVALTYAVNSGMRGGGKDASKESLELIASQMIQNAHLVEQTMMRARMVNDIPDWGFNLWPAHTANATCTQAACKIYANIGGPVPLYKVPVQYTTNGVDAGQGVAEIAPDFYVSKIIGIGTDANDVVLTYGRLKKDLCDTINRMAGNNVDSSINDGFGGGAVIYSGTLTEMPASTGEVGDGNTTLKGQKISCTYVGMAGQYRFLYPVMER